MDNFLQFWFWEASNILSRYLMFAGGAFILFYVILKKPLWFRKVQKRMPKLTDYGRDFMYSVITVTIFATVAFLVFGTFKAYTNFLPMDADISLTYIIFTWVCMFAIHDTYFYWMHRLMHLPRLFKTIHLVHHKSTNPSPWTAYAFHPFEAIVEVGILPLIAFTIPVVPSTLGWFFLFQIMYNVYGHLGFELYPKGFHKTWIGRWVNTSVAHNLHHKGFDGNYGLYFLIWDRIMGTIRKDYDETYELTTGSLVLSTD